MNRIIEKIQELVSEPKFNELPVYTQRTLMFITGTQAFIEMMHEHANKIPHRPENNKSEPNSPPQP